jgi:glycosyltransferase involved in cell wall biosynthesis
MAVMLSAPTILTAAFYGKEGCGFEPFRTDARMNPPKLLSINNFHYRRAGSDATFLDHDRLFRHRGWDTAVFSMTHAENDPTPWSHHFVREIELARRYSVTTRLRLAAKVLYSWEARNRLQALMESFRPNIVHVHSVYHHLSPSVLAVPRSLGVPVVLTAHDYKLACPAYKMFDGRHICEDCRSGSLVPLIRKRCIHGSLAMSSLVAAESAMHRALGSYPRSIARIVCPSRFMHDKLMEWGWPASRLSFVPNFFDPSLWQPRFKPGRYFLYFGRLAPEKGLPTLIRASAASGQTVVIVGWGRELTELQALAQELGAPVRFLERQAVTELAHTIRGCRAVIVPAEWYENASLASLEAFACGKPVIATQIGGNPEVVIPEVNGWLVPPGDPVALADRMRLVALQSEESLEALGRRAHAWVHRHRSPEGYYAAMTSLYLSVGARIFPEPLQEPIGEMSR